MAGGEQLLPAAPGQCQALQPLQLLKFVEAEAAFSCSWWSRQKGSTILTGNWKLPMRMHLLPMMMGVIVHTASNS